jgi:hypothetical protein
MSNDNGHVSLSAIDFLGLIKRRKVARLDLAEIGYEGVIYVRDITAAEQTRITRQDGKSTPVTFYERGDRYVIDINSLTEGGGAKFLAASAVTDKQDGKLLETAFAALDEGEEFVTFPADELIQMSDTWIKEAGNRDKMEKMLESTPNAIINLVVKTVRQLSGMAEDRVEEKKETS